MAKCAIHKGRGRAPKSCPACAAGFQGEAHVIRLQGKPEIITTTVGRTEKSMGRMILGRPAEPDKHSHPCGHGDRCSGAKCGECQACARNRGSFFTDLRYKK